MVEIEFNVTDNLELSFLKHDTLSDCFSAHVNTFIEMINLILLRIDTHWPIKL